MMMMMSFLCSCRNKIGAEFHIYLEEGTYHTRLMMMSFICSCRNKNQPKAIYPKGTSHNMRLFRGPSTNYMKK